MARTAGNKFGSNFQGGMAQDSGPLGYPENTARDLVNVVIDRNGAVSTRPPVRLKDGGTLPTFLLTYQLIADRSKAAFTVHEYFHPSNTINHLVVVQVGCELYALDTLGGYVSIKNFPSGNVNMYSMFRDRPSAMSFEGAAVVPLTSYSSGGKLFLTSKAFGPFYMKYLEDENELIVVPIHLRVRDYKGIKENIPTQLRPTSLSSDHAYNLYNQGWSGDRINKFFNGASS